MEMSGTGAGQFDRLVTGDTLGYSGNTLHVSMGVSATRRTRPRTPVADERERPPGLW